MKTISPAILIAFAFLFSSCQKELSVQIGTPPGAITTGTGTGSGAGNTHCKDCIYYPVCTGSVYNYSDTSYGSSAGTPLSYTLTYVKDTTIENKTYQKFTGAGQQNTYFNCTAGVSSTIILNGVTAGGTTLPYVKITQLKAAEAVGATWFDTINNAGQIATYTYTIVSKTDTRIVSGHTYTNVIHVHEQTTEDVPGMGTINAGQSEYYFASGVGLIESISVDDFSGFTILHHVLVSANIP